METITIKLTGRIDSTNAPEIEEMIMVRVEGLDSPSITLDFGELEYISSAGLRVLLASRQKMEGKDGMIVKNVSEDIMEVFEITGFTDILDIE